QECPPLAYCRRPRLETLIVDPERDFQPARFCPHWGCLPVSLSAWRVVEGEQVSWSCYTCGDASRNHRTSREQGGTGRRDCDVLGASDGHGSLELSVAEEGHSDFRGDHVELHHTASHPG